MYNSNRTCAKITERREETVLSNEPLDLSMSTSETSTHLISSVTSNELQYSNQQDTNISRSASTLVPINQNFVEHGAVRNNSLQTPSVHHSARQNLNSRSVHHPVQSENLSTHRYHNDCYALSINPQQNFQHRIAENNQDIVPLKPHYENNSQIKSTNQISYSPADMRPSQGPIGEVATIIPRQNVSNSYRPQVKDLLPLIVDFDPNKTSLKTFLQNIDRIVIMYGPDDLILMHAVTLKLKENARKWYESLNIYFQSWESFKIALIEEFSELRDAVDIHRALERHKCAPHENVIDYAYEMRRIASEANISEKDIIKYIISGLNNSNLIYSLSVMRITTFAELMSRLRAHNSVTKGHAISNNLGNRSATSHRPDNHVEFHPYKRQMRPIITCAYCKKDGHYAVQCIKNKNQNLENQNKQLKPNTENLNVKSINCIVANKGEYIKPIKLNGINMDAFVDLGSECTILCQGDANKIFSNYEQCTQKLRGFGNGIGNAIGKVLAKIEIDGIVLDNCEILIVRDIFQPASMIIGQNVLNREIVIAVKGFNFFKLINIPVHSNNAYKVEQLFKECESKKLDVAAITSQKDEFNDAEMEFIGENINESIKVNLINLFHKYRDCFALNMNEIGLTNKAEIELKLKDDKPVCYQPYRLAHVQRETVRKQVEKMLQSNIITPSISPYASPIVIVKKKSGEDRICIDYRKLNEKTVKDHFPLPHMDEQLQRMAGMKYFSVVDLASGYYQIPVAEKSRTLTAFVTPDGKYQFNRMPFGLVNAPLTFQRMMNLMATKLQNKIVTYLDDVVIPSTTIDEGIDLLKRFMDKLREYGLTMKPSKCKFLQTEIEFLGHEISHDDIRPGKRKILCVEKFEIPTNVHDVRRFIGLESYFRKFVPKFAEIAKPLTDLTKKNMAFVWSEDQDNAFNQLKTYLCARDTLALHDPELQHEVHTDASSIGLAGILMQVQGNVKRPVAYFSRKTNPMEQNYHSYELETLAVVESVERFRVYVLGKPFVVVTDCASIRTSATKKNLIPRVARWWLRLQEFDFEIKHRNGPQMAHVDALSRAPVLDSVEAEEATLDVFSIGEDNKWMIALQKTDEGVLEIKKKILEKDPTMKNFVIRNDCAFFKAENGDELFVIPKCLRSRIVSETHSSGHFGVEKTLGI